MRDHEEEKDRLKRKAGQEAIRLAMESRWQEAVVVNQTIIENFPTDVDAYNRLGRAFMEMGELDKAREAYRRTLEMDPHNAIAEKNLSRLSVLRESQVPVKEERRAVPPDIFIGEMGKVGVVNLQSLAPQEVLAKMAAGNQVNLNIRGQQLVVETELGEYMGLVEPQYGFRLAKLIEGGNKYTAAIVSVDNEKVRVIIREVYQHPGQAGRHSFPIRPVEGFHPHVKDSLLRHEAMEEETLEEAEETELEEVELLPEGFSIFERVTTPEGEPIEPDLLEEE